MSANDPCASCLGKLSRRRFLGSISGAAVGMALGGAALERVLAQESLSGRTQPLVRSVFLRPKGPYWLGWPGTSYDVEGHRREYTEKFTAAGEKLAVNVIHNADPLYDDAAVAEFMARVQKSPPEAILVTLLHIGYWPQAERIASLGIPTIIFSPIGTSFTGHTLGPSRRKGVYVVSSLELDAVAWGLKMVRAAFELRRQRILRVAGDERSDSVVDTVGIAVRHIPRRIFHELFAQTPDTDAVRALADDEAAHALRIVEPTRKDILNASRTYFTIKQLLQQENCTAFTSDCLGMVSSRVVPTPPCMAFSRLNDEGVTATCEADLFGCASMLFVSHLFDRPGFLQDPVAETWRNRFIGAHCTSATRLDGYGGAQTPYILRCHSESALGVSMQVLWPVGRKCTMVRFEAPDSLIVDSLTVADNVPTPPAGGCRTNVMYECHTVADARDIQGFHQVIFFGDLLPRVRDYCQLYGIRARTSGGAL